MKASLANAGRRALIEVRSGFSEQTKNRNCCRDCDPGDLAIFPQVFGCKLGAPCQLDLPPVSRTGQECIR
jgi:hypothetical protein